MSEKPKRLKRSAELQTDSMGYTVHVHYELEDVATGECIAAVNVNILYGKEYNVQISDAITNGVERARQALAEIVSLEQSDPQP